MMNKFKLLLFVAALFGCNVLWAQPTDIIANKIDGEVLIDGVASEQVWQQATKYDLRNPFSGEIDLDTSSTQFRILYDDNYIYIFYDAVDKQIRAKHTQADAHTYEDDVVEFFLAPHYMVDDFYFSFEVNALATVADFVFFPLFDQKIGYIISEYNPRGLKACSNIDGTTNDDSDVDNGYTLEMAIPITAFTMMDQINPIQQGSEWKVQVARWDKSSDKEEFSCYFPSLDLGPHQFDKFGNMIFGGELK